MRSWIRRHLRDGWLEPWSWKLAITALGVSAVGYYLLRWAGVV